MFCREIRKILCGYPLLSVAMYLGHFGAKKYIFTQNKQTIMSKKIAQNQLKQL